MSDYVNREDIDRLISIVNEIDIALKKQGVNSISELLSHYYDQSEIDVPLNNLKTNLGSLETQLTSLSSELDGLSFDLFGDDTTEGLQDYLNDLQVMIYGEGNSYVDDKGVTHTCTINDPCPESLKGRLGKLAIDLSGLSGDTAYLKDTLLVLSTYLTNFQGTLAQFKAKLAEHNIDYDELDTGITVLLEKIFVAQGAIGSVETRVGLVEDDIGKPTDSKAQGYNTVYGYLNDTSDLATETDGKVEDISNEDGTGSLDIVETRVDGITNDDGDGVLDVVVDTTIPAVKKKIGYSSIGNVDLQTQITNIVTQNTSITSNLLSLFNPSTDITEIYYGINIENPSIPSELSQLEALGYDTSTINYAVILIEHTTELYQKRSGGAWIKVSSFPEFTTAIGITYRFVEQRNTTPWLPFSYIYSVSTQQYFRVIK